jgi:hypothetical protein
LAAARTEYLPACLCHDNDVAKLYGLTVNNYDDVLLILDEGSYVVSATVNSA